MEDKLTIEHLSSYLPYGLEAINCFGDITIIRGLQKGDESVNNDLWKFKHTDGSFLIGYLYECKPTLRPLSDLTKEITHNGETFVPIEYINGEFAGKIPRKIETNQQFKNKSMFFTLAEWITFEELHSLNSLLFSWHFDVFGLLDKGLAVNINTLTNKEE